MALHAQAAQPLRHDRVMQHAGQVHQHQPVEVIGELPGVGQRDRPAHGVPHQGEGPGVELPHGAANRRGHGIGAVQMIAACRAAEAGQIHGNDPIGLGQHGDDALPVTHRVAAQAMHQHHQGRVTGPCAVGHHLPTEHGVVHRQRPDLQRIFRRLGLCGEVHARSHKQQKNAQQDGQGHEKTGLECGWSNALPWRAPESGRRGRANTLAPWPSRALNDRGGLAICDALQEAGSRTVSKPPKTWEKYWRTPLTRGDWRIILGRCTDLVTSRAPFQKPRNVKPLPGTSIVSVVEHVVVKGYFLFMTWPLRCSAALGLHRNESAADTMHNLIHRPPVGR